MSRLAFMPSTTGTRCTFGHPRPPLLSAMSIHGLRLAMVLSAVWSTSAFGQAPAPAQANATQKLYLAQCAKCHGPNGVPRPIAKGARRFADPGWSATIEGVQAVISNGKGEEMPRFKDRLTPAQIQALAECVLAFRNQGTK